jgi:hypothetical protein
MGWWWYEIKRRRLVAGLVDLDVIISMALVMACTVASK